MGRRRIRGTLVLVALCVVALSRPALADRPPTAEVLARASRQVDSGDFEGALITLQDGLSSPDTSNDELVRLYWKLGEVYVYLGRDDDAQGTFRRLLYVEADFDPPRLTSPRVRHSFEAVKRAFLASGRALHVELLPPEVAGPDRPVVVAATIRGMPPEMRARVYFRPALTEAWQWAELAPAGADDRFTATLPGLPAGSSLEYYAEIQSADGRRVQGDGSSLAPRSLVVPGPRLAATTPPPAAEPETPWYGHPWIWGVVAGAVVGGSVLAYVALQPSPATMHLTVRVTP